MERNARQNGSTVRSLLLISVFSICAFFLVPVSALASSGFELGAEEPPVVDTIVLTSGKKIPCMVLNISGTRIYYEDSVGDEQSYARRNIHKIMYSSGKTQTLNDVAVGNVEETDWRIIIITEDTKQVQGLYPRGMVYGESSPSNKTLRSAQRSAETRLKKRAVAKEGLVVLVTKRLKTGGYGEVPTYRIEGEVYGVEPLPEGEDPEKIESAPDKSSKEKPHSSKKNSSKKKKRRR